METTLLPLSNVRSLSPNLGCTNLTARGDKIQASVSKEEGPYVDIEVGCVYKIAQFRVIPNNRPVRFTNSTFRLIFHAGTTIFGHGDPSIPREAWSFYDTAEIEICRGTFSHLIDFIGLLSAVSPVRRLVTHGRISKMINMEMIDPVGRVRCVLLGELVELLMLHLCSNWVNRPIVIFEYFLAKYIRGDKLNIFFENLKSELCFQIVLQKMVYNFNKICNICSSLYYFSCMQGGSSSKMFLIFPRYTSILVLRLLHYFVAGSDLNSISHKSEALCIKSNPSNAFAFTMFSMNSGKASEVLKLYKL
ncbi:uncharacterized protein LOC130712198 [Lotus japonicus]|uniref:uncharacterized protein LOC130712198 n=1 Tax=Lotus japonicus TaxID=34305 RepID=UPI00258A4AEA|nr:uncharacterized protein LOC130712198 [Lotus japonicus]